MTVETIRPGRTIELVEATLVAGERPVVRARAWRIARGDTASVAGGLPEPLPPPDTFAPWDGRRLKKRDKYQAMAERALDDLDRWIRAQRTVAA